MTQNLSLPHPLEEDYDDEEDDLDDGYPGRFCRTIHRKGVTYYFRTNVVKGDHFHKLYLAMRRAGLVRVIISSRAFDRYGNLIRGSVAIFTPEEDNKVANDLFDAFERADYKMPKDIKDLLTLQTESSS